MWKSFFFSSLSSSPLPPPHQQVFFSDFFICFQLWIAFNVFAIRFFTFCILSFNHSNTSFLDLLHVFCGSSLKCIQKIVAERRGWWNKEKINYAKQKTNEMNFMKKKKSRGKMDASLFIYLFFYISPKEVNIYYKKLKREKMRKDILSWVNNVQGNSWGKIEVKMTTEISRE